MKTNVIWILIVICIGLTTCSEDENDCCNDNSINYPDSGNFGANILDDNITDIQGTPYTRSYSPYYYSMCAQIPDGISVVILINKITSTGTTTWSYESSTRVGWSISSYESGGQQFMATGPIYCDLQICFWETGTVEITLYYHGIESPAWTKTLNWN